MSQKSYRPSNGTEGMWFCAKFCDRCIHGRYEHTGDVNDNPCEILTASFMCDINDPLYPKEWVYDSEGEPTCTAWKKWDWGRDDDGNWVDPPLFPPDTDNPNQLVMPFIFDELNIKDHDAKSSNLHVPA
jgi:hypothetical protein